MECYWHCGRGELGRLWVAGGCVGGGGRATTKGLCAIRSAIRLQMADIPATKTCMLHIHILHARCPLPVCRPAETVCFLMPSSLNGMYLSGCLAKQGFTSDCDSQLVVRQQRLVYAGVALFRKARSVVLKIWSLPGSAMRELRSLLAVFFFGWPPEEPMGRQPDAASANNADAGGAGFFLASGGQPAAGHPDASEPQELPDVAEMQQQEPVQVRSSCGSAEFWPQHTRLEQQHKCQFQVDGHSCRPCSV